VDELQDEFSHDTSVGPNEYALLATPEANELLDIEVPEAWVLDYDRTLGDVSAAMDRLLTVAGQYGIDTAEITAAQAQVEADGGSFDPLAFVETALSAEDFAAFSEDFVATEQPALLYSDAQRLLDRLSDNDIPIVVMTYGTNPQWQRLKLAASGYTGAVKIMDDTDKGRDMEDMRSADGTFDFAAGAAGGRATLHAAKLGLVDDKRKSFAHLPADSDGYLIQRGEQLPSQQGELPDRVKIIASLDELAIVNGRMVLQEPPLAQKAEIATTRDHIAPVVYVPLKSTGEQNSEFITA
jgi:hypothetical protein